jgi:sulfoxide reductase heme-binding subunit YedZ
MASTHLFWYLSRSSGFLAYTCAWSSTIWGLAMTTRYVARADRAALYVLHRLLGLGSVVFLGVHLIALYLDPWAQFTVADLAVPFHTTYRPFWTGCGILAAVLIVAIVFSSLMQARLGRVVWRGIHYLSFLTFALGVVHGLGSGTDSGTLWGKGWYALTAAAVAGLCANRVIWGIQTRQRIARPAAVRHINPRSHALRTDIAQSRAEPWHAQRVRRGGSVHSRRER